MALTKPGWLRSLLNKLNWDIFTWKVYVGDAIEDGIDWVIDWLNEAIKWGTDAWNDLCKETTKIWNKIDTWWSDLSDWWKTKVTWLRDLIDTAEDWLKDRIGIIKQGLASLRTSWDNFWQNTWPQLVKDFNTWVVKVGNFFTSILPGLAEKLDITNSFNSFRLEWSTLFNFWGSLGREVMSFFTSPLDWLKDRIETWFWGGEK